MQPQQSTEHGQAERRLLYVPARNWGVQAFRGLNVFGPDPIDFFDPSPYLAISYYGHILIGIVAVLAALLAFASLKGGTWHRRAGWTFLAAVAVVCVTSIEMLANVFIPPLFMAVFTAIYAAGGAWLALQRGTRAVRIGEWALFVFELAGLAIFLSVALAAVRAGIVPAFAPWVIAAIPLILLAGDIHWFANQDRRAHLRVLRHLSRMVWAVVVVVRAPLVELAAGGLPLPPPVVIVGPIAAGLLLIAWFGRRYRTGRLRAKVQAS